MDQIFALQQVFEKSWEYAKEVYTCFADFERDFADAFVYAFVDFDLVPRDKLWTVLLKYDVRGQLLAAIKLLYKQSKVYVRVNGMKTKSFSVRVSVGLGCVLSPLLFIKYMDKIDRDSSSSGGVIFGELNVRRLLFADDFVLSSSNKSDFQYALDRFSDACLDTEMKISTAKTGIMCMSKHPFQCSFQTNEVTL